MTKLVNCLKNQENNIIIALLLVAILLGTVPITDIKILGVVPTFYRVGIPLLAVYFCYRHATTQESIWKNKVKIYKALFFLWIFGSHMELCKFWYAPM